MKNIEEIYPYSYLYCKCDKIKNIEEIYSYISDKNDEIKILYDFSISIILEIYSIVVVSKCGHYIDFKVIYEVIKYLGNKYGYYINSIRISDYNIEEFIEEDIKIFESFNSPENELSRISIHFKNVMYYFTDKGGMILTNDIML